MRTEVDHGLPATLATLATSAASAAAEWEVGQRLDGLDGPLEWAETLLAAALDYPAALAGLARLAVPALADWSFVHSLDGDGRLHPAAVAHSTLIDDTLAHDLLQRYMPRLVMPFGPPPWTSPWRDAGRVAVAAEHVDLILSTIARDAQHLRRLRALDVASIRVVPLMARGRMLGALSLWAVRSRPPATAADLARLGRLARLGALAIDNARQLRDAQESLHRCDTALAAVSHDLKAPLATIKGYVYLLKRQTAGLDMPGSERLTEHLGIIDAKVTQTSALIDRWLVLGAAGQ